ncbi:MAG: hypothetical protein DSY90_10575 [Deltaproteobacteria bacterium]|nr:MAG: hypothetical protein DSY90_10575 [Deltaproteobacteria bacterium]
MPRKCCPFNPPADRAFPVLYENRMIPVAVIADDLTGAADTGIQFCRAMGPACLLGIRSLKQVRFSEIPGVLSVYTNSRHLPASGADKSVRSAMRYLNAFEPQSLYKKIDSCLRGNIGTEMDAVMDAWGGRTSFVAPAFPAQGRTTLHGIHYLHGTPLSETEMAMDPVTPVHESSLPALLTRQSRLKVGHIDVDILDDGNPRVKDEVRRRIEDGCRHIVFDACTEHHLKSIAQLAKEYFPKTLLAGSAGLAAGMVAAFNRIDARPRVSELFVTGNMLWACGSASEHLAGQVRLLVEKGGLAQIKLPPAILADAGHTSAGRKLAALAEHPLTRNDLVLQIGPGSAADALFSPEEVLSGFSTVVENIVARCQPAALFLSGGDTAAIVLEAIGTRFVILKNEVLPGLTGGIISGGLMDGRVVVTKAGAFGQPDDLLTLYNRLKRKEA